MQTTDDANEGVLTLMARSFRWGAGLLLLLANVALADSWRPPTQQQYESEHGNVRATVTPRPLAGALPYFRDKVDGVEPAGQLEGSTRTGATATVERRDETGAWQPMWNGPLRNDVAPVSALVSDSGYLVTFDNWHSVGYGNDVVVIYDERGQSVRQMGLSDFLPAGYIVSLPRSVSSLHWGTEHALVDGGRTLELHIAAPGTDFDAEQVDTIPLRFDLASGRLLAVQDAAWPRALEKVARLDEERRARWAALRVRRAAPLPAPSATDTASWRAYLVELRERLNDATGEAHAGAVLPKSGRSDYPDSPGAIAKMLEFAASGRDYAGTHYLFVSPASDALAALLERQLRDAPAGSMQGVHVAFVGTPREGEQVRLAAARAGATIRLIDKDLAYPGQALPVEMPELFE